MNRNSCFVSRWIRWMAVGVAVLPLPIPVPAQELRIESPRQLDRTNFSFTIPVTSSQGVVSVFSASAAAGLHTTPDEIRLLPYTNNGSLLVTCPTGTNQQQFFAASDSPGARLSDYPETGDIDATDDTGSAWDVAFTGLLTSPLRTNAPITGQLFAYGTNGRPLVELVVLRPVLLDANNLPVAGATQFQPSSIVLTNGFASFALGLAGPNIGPGTKLGFVEAPAGGANPPPGAPVVLKLIGLVPAFLEPWTRPVSTSYRVSGSFGEWPGHTRIHLGMDWAAPELTDVFSANAGTVMAVNPVVGLVRIQHLNGFVTTYLHINPSVQKDAVVSRGAVIGKVGKFPPTSVHLHFELWEKNVALNPVDVIPGLQANDPIAPQMYWMAIRAENPATQAVNPGEISPTPSTDTAYVSVGIRDYAAVGAPNNIAPRAVGFAAINQSQVIDLRDSDSVRQLFQNPSQPGYSKLTRAEFTPANSSPDCGLPAEAIGPDGKKRPLLSSQARYKFWFPWDTREYATAPYGPKQFAISAVDGRKTTDHTTTITFDFGPEQDPVRAYGYFEDSEGLMIQQFLVTIVGHLGSAQAGLTQPDHYDVRLSGSGTFRAEQLSSTAATPYALFPSVQSFQTPRFMAHGAAGSYFFVRPARDRTPATIRATSRLIPNIAHEVGHYVAPLSRSLLQISRTVDGITTQHACVGQTITISGLLKSPQSTTSVGEPNAIPLDKASIDILINGIVQGTATTRPNGTFSYSYVLTSSIFPGSLIDYGFDIDARFNGEAPFPAASDRVHIAAHRPPSSSCQ